MIVASAPGKIHLSGEHAVVYGEPAIISSVDKRCFVKAEKSDIINVSGIFTCSVSEALKNFKEANEIRNECLESKDFSKLYKKMKNNFMKIMSGCLIDKLGVGGFNLDLNVDIPTGYGMGSSAAISCAVTKAVSELYGINKTKDDINKIAYDIECFSHGTPSGGDNTTSCYGGILLFQNKEFKTVDKEISIPKEFLIIHTGKPKKTTAELVDSVRNLDIEYRNQLVKKIGKCSIGIYNSLKSQDIENFKEKINLCQEYLKGLKISTPVIDNLCDTVKNFGGAAKLSGAGGGGTVICYHEDLEKLKLFLESKNYSSEKIKIGVEGVRKEN